MKLIKLVEYLKARDVKLSVSGGNIKYNAPGGMMTPEIKDQMLQHKAEIISILAPQRLLAPVPHYDKLILGDCEDQLKKFPDNSTDLIVTDPPYGYKFMGKDWDKAVPSIEIWKECNRVLKPGAFAFIMSSPRQDVLCRNLINIEKAGFRTNFTSLYWAYASGYPKAHNISKAIDKKLSVKREIIGRNPNSRENSNKSNTIYESGTVGKTAYITKPATEEARRLNGSYAGFQPKPAVEVIIVAMKPMDKKTYTNQALSNGKGITWLDDCLIPYENEPVAFRDLTKQKSYNGNQVQASEGDEWIGNDRGRFPANLLVSDDVLDDTSRFFSLDAWADLNIKDLPEQVQRNLPFLIVPKASPKEKNAGINKSKEEKKGHPTVKPIKLMSYLITMGSREGDMVLDPFSGSGTTCVAASLLNRRYVGIEIKEEYFEIASQRISAEIFRHHVLESKAK
jgi:site-specific DNA-methyltransferase (adenine-specific)